MGALQGRMQERMAALFQRCPMLAGFSVQESAGLAGDRIAGSLDEALCLADVAVDFGAGFGPAQALCDEIGREILELLDEEPAAYDLLRGRTFARQLH